MKKLLAVFVALLSFFIVNDTAFASRPIGTDTIIGSKTESSDTNKGAKQEAESGSKQLEKKPEYTEEDDSVDDTYQSTSSSSTSSTSSTSTKSKSTPTKTTTKTGEKANADKSTKVSKIDIPFDICLKKGYSKGECIQKCSGGTSTIDKDYYWNLVASLIKTIDNSAICYYTEENMKNSTNASVEQEKRDSQNKLIKSLNAYENKIKKVTVNGMEFTPHNGSSTSLAVRVFDYIVSLPAGSYSMDVILNNGLTMKFLKITVADNGIFCIDDNCDKHVYEVGKAEQRTSCTNIDIVKTVEPSDEDQSGTYSCWIYTHDKPAYNTTVWTDQNMVCDFQQTGWSKTDCKNGNLHDTVESIALTYKCEKGFKFNGEWEEIDGERVRNCLEKHPKKDKVAETSAAEVIEKSHIITHSGYNNVADFYDMQEKTDEEIVCENLAVLHIVYRIATIAAPILVILFVSFDLVSSLISGDEKKIAKFREKIIRRIIALVLLLVIPIIIGILVKTLSRNGVIRDTSYLSCVVNGNPKK